MDRLAGEASLSFTLLLLSFICVYYALHKRTTFARYSMVVLFITCGTPLAMMVILHRRSDYIGADIGLGLAFMLTWGITALVFIVSVITWLLRIRKRT